MAKYDEQDFKENGRVPNIGSDEEPNLDVAMLSPLIERELILETTNSGERVVTDPLSNEIVPGMSIVAENGGFEEKGKNASKTTRAESTTDSERE